LRDVGSFNTTLAPSEVRLQPQPPLPFPKGCGHEGGGKEGAGEGETRWVRREKQGGEGEEQGAAKEREITTVGGPNWANPTQQQPMVANSAQRQRANASRTNPGKTNPMTPNNDQCRRIHPNDDESPYQRPTPANPTQR